MHDKLFTIPIDKLLAWILAEEKNGKIFGYFKEMFFVPKESDHFKIKRYNQILDTPLGVAAGPHTQLSQNIILSWLFGARFIELKTVQVLDSIEVAKPCIDMYDEGFNCEWSQELSIEESFNQYLDAWIILHILSEKYNYKVGTIFNVSVGYDLKGVMSEKVRWFLTKIKNAKDEIEDKKLLLKKIVPSIMEIEIPSEISNNITLSTMHGCPANEIEGIAQHLIEDWKFHAAVKLNPTLIGKERLTKILNKDLGYKIEIPNEAFEHDIKFEDAKKLIKNLTKISKRNGVEFALKMTNTLESLNSTVLLPDSQKMVYMSGRALHPISVSAAALLQREFDGSLDISFSGGADAFNFSKLIACNLKPVTVCSDLLKPGGYSRIPQYLENLRNSLKECKAESIDEFILSKNEKTDLKKAAKQNLLEYSESVIKSDRYKKSFSKNVSIKTKRELTEIDCIHPPCVETCAISQDVPNYLYHTANENYDLAFQTILEGNPLPNITGMVCDHLCQTKCTRMNIDDSLMIREIKRYISDKAEKSFNPSIENKSDAKIAIIGGGPSGLSAAYFLALKGCEIVIYEKHESAGGMAKYAIPQFRIDEEALLRDIKNIESLGVKFLVNQKIDKKMFSDIYAEYDFIYVAVGAQKGKSLGIVGENLENVIDQLAFLRKVKNSEKINLGKKVAIIGGGNSAMDAARSAKRLVPTDDGEVTVLYRRTINEMPADKEEVHALLEENISVIELTSPKEIIKDSNSLILKCVKMQLGELDQTGRRKPKEVINSNFLLSFDTIITAVGQEVEIDFLPENKLKISQLTKETQIAKIYAGGDAVRSADSLINAIADGKIAAENIIQKLSEIKKVDSFKSQKISLKEYQKKLSQRIFGEKQISIPLNERNNFNLVNPILDDNTAVNEASRCLFCDEVCNVCVSVCPNLANYYFENDSTKIKYPQLEIVNNEFNILGKKEFSVDQNYQIININDFCNECGNCETFCPTSGAPYKIKPRFSLSDSSFSNEQKGYRIFDNSISYKENGEIKNLVLNNNFIEYSDNKIDIKFDKDFIPVEIRQKTKEPNVLNMEKIIEMYFYLSNLKKTELFYE